MKKLLALLLVLAMLFSFTACNKKTDGNGKTSGSGETEAPKDTVTIYIPIAEKVKPASGSEISVSYAYEDKWQEKDTFTFSFVGSLQNKNQKTTVTVSDRKMVTETTVDGKKATTEEYYDQNGRVTKAIAMVAVTAHTSEKTETLNTYDSQGRLSNQRVTSYSADGEVSNISVVPFTYESTSTGSTGTGSSGQRIMVYNKENQLIREVVKVNGQEVSCIEYSYKDGRQDTITSYSLGKLEYTVTTTYEAVAVSPEKAAMLPWAK
jgi:hypothetical protein